MRLAQILLFVIEVMWLAILYLITPTFKAMLIEVISLGVGMMIMWTIALDHFILSKRENDGQKTL